MGIRLDELTVILPTRNEAHNIRNFLKSLPEINLIVIDASEDPTPDIVYSLRPDYTELIRYPGTVTEARRIGADTAKTPWLLFTDADIVFLRNTSGISRKLKNTTLSMVLSSYQTATEPITNGSLTGNACFTYWG